AAARRCGRPSRATAPGVLGCRPHRRAGGAGFSGRSRSDLPGTAVLFLDRDPDGLGDAALELGRHVVAALRRHDLAQLHLEVEALRARWALVEVAGDRTPAPDRELAVEVLVDANDRFVAVHRSPAIPPLGRRPGGGPAPPRIPTTPSAAAFFLGAAGS